MKKPTTAPKKRPRRKRVRQPWFLKEWRELVGINQEELAGRIGVFKGDISNWEKAKRRYNQDILEMCAGALGLSTPGLLLMDPGETKLWTVWNKANATQRRDIERLAEVVAGRTPDGE